MQITVGTTGFCKGVQRAVDVSIITAERVHRKIYTTGPLIHNMQVIESLKKRNIFPLDKLSDLASGDILVISAHGISPKIIDSIQESGVDIVDATCPFVLQIHEKVKEYSRDGYGIIILGDGNHTEVKGIAGCSETPVQISDRIDDLSFDANEKYLVVAQTTFDIEKYKNIKQSIENLLKTLSKIVVFFNSICYTTQVRQSEAISISRDSDAVVVVGDKHSSNSLKLFELAKTHCKEVYFIERASEMPLSQKENIKKLGLLSGASTPKELIMEVIEVMNEENINGNVEVTDVTVSNNEAVEEAATEKVQAETTKEKATEPKEMSMKDAMKKYGPKSYREGMRLKAKVVSADVSGIDVSVDGLGKNDSGFIEKGEVELDGTYNPENYKPNDELDVVIIPKTPGDKSRRINLSKKAFDAIKIDDEKVKGILAGDEFSISCTQEIKGGLLGKIGTYTVFVPASQIKPGFVQNLADYLNKPLRLKALPPKEEKEDEEGRRPRNPKRIVASQRLVLEEEKKEREEEFWSSIPVGTVVHGKVKRFAAFGAFVSLRYMDALVHNSELSWSRKKIMNPEEILTLNKSYDFVVLAADRDTGKISLGYKQLQPKPYEIAAEKYPVGTVATGTVVRITKFGVFVELEPGIDGLVHVSQITHGFTQNASDLLKVGQEVEVKVIKFEDERITLSIKELLPEDSIADVGNAGGEDKADGKKRQRRERTVAEDEGPREYISSSTSATLADLFKDYNN